MEEATELFSLMDAMLQARPPRIPVVPRPAQGPSVSPGPVISGTAPGPSDDWLLLGLLALGAGAGLFAATAKRMTSGSGPPGPADRRANRTSTSDR